MLIAQISDTHIRPPGMLYQDVADSNAIFSAALRHLNALDPRPDLVLLSGDIVDRGTPAEYTHARTLLAALDLPLLVIPGNHDERAAFRAAFGDHAYLPADGPMHYAAGGHGPVRIIALDVTLPGLHHGAVDDAALAWLDRTLAEEPARPTMVMMHQPPFACGIAYMDKYWCEGGERLGELLRRHPAVERVVCGHVHRTMLLRFAGTVLCTAPSTTAAIALRLQPDAAPASYMEPPACLLHHWTKESGIVTHVSPIGDFAGPYPFA